jgi:hypothetical protein
MRPRRLAGVALGACLALAIPAPALAQSSPRRVVIAFVHGSPGRMLDRLAAEPRLSALALLDPTEGNYNAQQELLDLTQSSRVSRASYTPRDPPALALGADGRVAGWAQVRARARSAAGDIDPGGFAQSIPGGIGYAVDGPLPGIDGVLAADGSGRVAEVSTGAAGDLAPRVRALLTRHRVIVADVSLAGLGELLGGRPADQLLLVLEQPPPTAPNQGLPPRLLALAAAGLSRRDGFVTALDIAPTALHWLGIALPSHFKGRPMTVGGSRDARRLERLDARLGVIAGRRIPTIEAFLLVWLGLLLLAGAVRDRRGVRAMLRLGGLAALWTPSTVLFTGVLHLNRLGEISLIVGAAFVLAAVTDRVAPWPRGPALPAAVMLIAYAVDLARGSPLIVESLLGSNPIFGARFYGLGNELEASLPVVLFAGLAAVLPQRPATRRETAIFAVAGLAFTAIAAWGRLGADVGALFTIGGGTAAATLLLVPGGMTLRRLVLAGAVPFAGLGALALFDSLTGAGGHYTQTVLHANSAGDVLDTFRRKLEGAWRELRHGVMPLNTAVCLAGAAYAIRHRVRVLAPLGDAHVWWACLGGAFAGSLLGSLANDSGPLLLVVGSFGIACVIAYVRGDPRLDERSYAPLSEL